MPLRCERYEQACVIGVDGELAGENAAALRAAVERQIEEHHVAHFVVDLENSDFIDSEGLETLLWLKRRCEALFGQVQLAGLQDNCRKILQITRLEPCFQCQRDLPSALRLMR
jgi:anti-anti-sigma factor